MSKEEHGGFKKVAYKNKKNNDNNLQNRDIELKNLQRRIHSPKVDLVERDQLYLVRIELPGVTPESTKLQIKDQQIIFISGSKKLEDSYETDRVIYRESKYNDFVRRIKLPGPIKYFNLNQKLDFSNGVLYLKFEKAKSSDLEKSNEIPQKEISSELNNQFSSINLENKVDWSEL
jgi:HSP20 family molecular chaperone IbpA